MSTDCEAQQDEMLAMESIFDGETFQIYEGEIRSGQIKIRVDIPDPLCIVVTPQTRPKAENVLVPANVVGHDLRFKVQYLPPLTLHFTLPKNYPSQAKPNFTLSSVWLHRASLSVLCQKLDEIWEENKGMGVLFSWANYLQACTLTAMGIRDIYDVDWVIRPKHLSKRNSFNKAESIIEPNTEGGALNGSPVALDQDADEVGLTDGASDAIGIEDLPVEAGANTSRSSKGRKRIPKSRKAKNTKIICDQRAATDTVPRKEDGKDTALLDYLLTYNEDQIRETFLQSSHSCDICFTIKIGHSCVRFRCGHVFCEECVCGFFTTNITEGNVEQVKCLAFNCKMRPTPELVKQLLGETLYDRYDQILLKRALESMSDITYCPRPKCRNPVMCDPNEKCALCTVCGYTFCSTCKMVYHGVEPCRFKDADMKDVFKKYTEGSAEEKKALVKAYGEKQLKVLVENVLSEQWIQKESKQCPHCRVHIEKFEGCNKVTCFKCNTYFCWLCLKQLEQGNPYFHFNDPSSKCYNNLFQDIGDDGQGNEWIHHVLDDDTDSSDDDDMDFFDSDFENDYE